MTAKAPMNNARPFRMIAGVSTLSDLADGSSAWTYPGNYPGKIYYVNNITGSSTNDGSDWDHAMDQVDTALLASEHNRHDRTSSNLMVRNVIFVQGTETAYSKVDQDANGFDMIGIGCRMHLGGAAGDVMISGASAADGMAMTDLLAGWDTTLNKGGGLGCNFYNIHFEASGGAYYAVDLEDFLLSSFEDCSFMTSSADTTGGGLHASQHFAGSLIRNCTFGGDSGSQAYGLNFSEGGVFNNNLIENCWANSKTYGYYNAKYLQGGSVIRNNQFYGGTVGLADASSETTLLGLALYTGNYTGGTTGMSVTNGASRCIGNWAVTTAGTGTWYTDFS